MTIRIISFLLAVVFLASGGAKLASLPFEIEAFTRWGYPLAFMYVIGALEVAGAVGLLVRKLSSLAALCLACLMVGAMVTHAIHSEWPMLAIAFSITLLAAWRGWVGRGDLKTLLPGSGRSSASRRAA